MQANQTLDDLLAKGAELYGAGQSGAAAQVYRQAMAMAPENPTLRLRYALAIWHGENRAEEALAEIEALEAAYPQAAVHGAAALILNSLGRFRDGAAAARRAVTADPAHTTSWLDLATAVEAGEAGPLIAELTSLLQGGDATRAMRRDLHFAMALALRKAGRVDAAFTHMECGNGFSPQRWDHDRERDIMAGLRAVFTPDLMERLGGAGHPDRRMIFIVGMPRSGTTLVERMLSAHPEVRSVGETPIVGNLYGQFEAQAGKTVEKTRNALQPAALQAIGRALVDGMGGRLGGASPAQTPARIIDKMPANYLFLPLIALALPQARIVHLRRHPLDTCLSCYEASFSFGLDFAANQVSLGAAYRQYAAITDAWARLPGVRIHDLFYARLTEDPEAEMRALLDHCGLAWDERCLAPAEGGPIKTASVAQARGAVSTGSVGRWRRFESRLQPLIEALGGMDWIDDYWSSAADPAHQRGSN